MKMKMKEPLCVSVLAFILLVVTDPTGAEGKAEPRRNPGVSGTNLQQKMFTLSRYGGGLTLFAPYLDPPNATMSYPTDSSRPDPTRYDASTAAPPTRGYPTQTTRSWPKTTRYYPWTTRYDASTAAPPTRGYPTQTTRPKTTRYYPWTTPAPPTGGVSVCLRLITSDTSTFTLSPSRTPLSLQVTDGGWYVLRLGSNQLRLRPSIPIWPNIGRSMWNSVCLTVDFTKSVVQMFSNMNMSTRKLLTDWYRWSGEPVITFSGFDGQLTDVQVWDYPLRYKEVLYYMSHGYYGSVQGSLLTWSNIRYSLQGRSLLEDSYEWQMKLPISKKRRGWALKKKARQDFRHPEI